MEVLKIENGLKKKTNINHVNVMIQEVDLETEEVLVDEIIEATVDEALVEEMIEDETTDRAEDEILILMEEVILEVDQDETRNY